MEHIKNVEKSYVSQIQSLNPGGTIIHLYPLGYHPFSLLNKMLGNNLVKKIISITKKESSIISGYPAFYSLGNPYKLEKFLKQRKNICVRFDYHYGALDYFTFFFPFALLVSMFNFINKTFKIKIFASNVIVEINHKG